MEPTTAEAEPSAPTRSEPGPWDSPVVVALRLAPHIALMVMIFFAARVGGLQVTNPDTYFHLRFGEEFWGHWSPWHPGSVTRFATREWLPTQWLGEIVMGRFEAWFGLPGVAWLTGLWIVAYAVALYLACRRRAIALVAIALAALALLASGDGLSGRPQMLSYLLMVVVVDAWLRTADDGRPRWWLVGVAWIWPLLHGMWLLGVVTSAVAAVGVVLDRRAELDRRATLRLLGVPVAMAVASACTPIGPQIYGAVLLVGSRSSYFTEWGPPNYHKPLALLLALLLVVLIVALLRQGTRTGWFLVLMTLLCCGWAIYSTRTLPIAAASAAPLAAAVLGRRFGSAAAEYVRDRWIALAMAAVALVGLAVTVPFTADQPRAYPSWVDQELDRLPARTPVLAADFDGSYLLWRHPRLDFVANGYGDLFTDAELERNRALYLLQPGWEQDLARLGVHVAVLPDGSSLAQALTDVKSWRVEHRSGGLEYLVAP